MNKERKVTLCGQELDIRMNMAVEIAYEEIVEKPFNLNDVRDHSRDRLAFCMAAILSNNPDCELTMDNLLKDATATEIAALTVAVFEAFADWCKVPAVMAEDNKTDEDSEDSAKN